MTLVTRHTEMPKGKDGWDIWGRNKRSQTVCLGEFPRLSIGEKLLKPFREYYQIDTSPQKLVFECRARSASGELYFRVHFEVSCQIRKDRASEVISVQDPLDTFVKSELIQEAQVVSEGFVAEDDKGLQGRLSSYLDPKRGGSFDAGPIQLLRVVIRVHIPKEIKATEEQMTVLQGLSGRIAAAEALGDTAEADRLRKARLALREEDRLIRGDILDASEDAKKLGEMIRIAEANEGPNSQYVLSLKARQRDMLKSSSSDPVTPIDADAPSAEITRDDLDDPDDLN